MPTPTNPKNDVAAGGDTTDYSATKAPENREHVESTAPVRDSRQKPGGANGTPADVGMSALHRRDVPSMANYPDEERGSPAASPNGSGENDPPRADTAQ